MTPEIQTLFDELKAEINRVLDTEISKAIDDMMLNHLSENEEIWDDVYCEYDYDEMD